MVSVATCIRVATLTSSLAVCCASPASPESRAPPPTHAAAASHSASSGAASSVQSRSGASAFAASTSSGSGPTPAANSFNAAFASFTNSAMYVPLAQMPMPAPATTSAASAARAGAPASASAATIARPTPPKATSAHSILVSPRQKGNPLLVHISNVAWSFGEKSLVCDYEIGETTCALYLSLKYHMLHGGYLQSRLTAVKQQYTARVILVYVDVEDSEKSLMDISRLAFAFSWTVVCCWSPEEMARSDRSKRAPHTHDKADFPPSPSTSCMCFLLLLLSLLLSVQLPGDFQAVREEDF